MNEQIALNVKKTEFVGKCMECQNDKCNIKISLDEEYIVDSTNNKPYDIVMNPRELGHKDFYKVLSIAINLFYKQLRIALIGDYCSFDSDCAILDDEVLTVLQNDTINQICIIDGELLLTKKLDCFGYNFGIYKVQQGYLIYGETEIIMLDFEFNKKWQFSGADIFVSASGEKAFELCENSIKLYDFQNNFYEIDFNGKLISKD